MLSFSQYRIVILHLTSEPFFYPKYLPLKHFSWHEKIKLADGGFLQKVQILDYNACCPVDSFSMTQKEKEKKNGNNKL